MISGGRFADPAINVILWGSAAAASLVAVLVALSGPALLAWAGIGYVVYAALLASPQVSIALLALAVSLMPVTQRPRRSLALGILVATAVAFAAREVVTRIVP